MSLKFASEATPKPPLLLPVACGIYGLPGFESCPTPLVFWLMKAIE